jgi:hypothetical protein
VSRASTVHQTHIRRQLGGASLAVIRAAFAAGVHQDVRTLLRFLAAVGWEADHLLAPVAAYFGFAVDGNDRWFQFRGRAPRNLHLQCSGPSVASGIALGIQARKAGYKWIR